MSIARTNFDDISESDLNDLIQAGVPEGLVIEYKRDPYGNSDAHKKEALKDITSFANSAGGHLIIGVKEAKGIPTELTGLQGVDPDALINRLESLVRDGVEPRIVGTRMRPVSLSRGGVAIVIRIPRSWNPPHRVSTGRSNRFYLRNSGGAHEASVEELRVLFTLAADAQQRIRVFRSDRIATIVAGQGSVLLPYNGRMFVHLVPLSAFGHTAQIDLEKAFEVMMRFRPMGPAINMTRRFNLDGFIDVRDNGRWCSCMQVFRNGILEATQAGVLYERGSITFLYEGTVRELVDVLPDYLEGLQGLDVPTPIVVMISYQGVAGAKLGTHSKFLLDADETEPFPPVDPLLLPEVIVDDYGSRQDYAQVLRPVFDALWNAAGFPRCPYYDADGNWRPPH